MKRREFIFKAEKNAKEEFQGKLTNAFPIEVVGEPVPFFYEAEEISQFAENVKAQVGENFGRKFNPEPERVRKSLLQKLENILNEMLRDFLTNNQLQKGKAEEKISSLQKQLVTDYIQEIKSFLEQNEFAKEEILEEIHIQFKSRRVAAFGENSSSSSASALEISANHHDHHQKHREYLEKSRNDLESKLEKEYESLCNSHKRHLSEVSSIVEEIVEELIENYKENLRNYISTACKSQKDLQIYHDSISSSFLSQFNEEQNPYPDSNPERSHFSEKLEKGLNSVFESGKMKLEQDIRALDDIYREAIKDCAVRYEEKMERFLKDEATSLEELEVAHFQTLDEETKLLEEAVDLKIDLNQNQAVRQANLPGYVENLESSVAPIFDLIKMKLALLQDEAKALAIEWKLECKTLYETTMKENLEMADDMESLQSFHKAATLSAGEALMDKMTDEENRHVSFDILASELESELETKWIEFQAKFEDKLKAKLAKLKEIVGQAQEHYNREMETHFLNNQFIRPDYLEELHKAAVSVAISKVGGESDSKLSSEITSALDKFLSDFQTRNDMNLNIKFKPAIGIDLGTTNCCVGVYKNGEVTIIPAKDRDNFKTTPSYVSFNDEGTKCVAYGHAAKDLFYINQKTTIFDVKRIIGKPMSDPLLQKDTETWPFKVTAGERGQPMIQPPQPPHSFRNFRFAPSPFERKRRRIFNAS
ncbi:Heat shock 70 kDa protein [Orchesella cincta]|uniref:Heat shock 70 kDa protein n=1 Tax=Orchesella cincta TaxID=48709 RepID=A0A1D2MK10_ORCCI|nr:Heat shock 70 kDa protein [Orchesella cincta]